MTPQQFYLVCFAIGFVLSILGAFGGTFHWPSSGGAHAWHGFHLPKLHGTGHGGGGISPYNFATLMAFLSLFGGVGYLLSSHGGFAGFVVAGIAIAAGIAGAALVFVFLTRVLLRHERSLDAADYEMVGVLGRVTVPIREGGTGEVVYSQGGTRKSVGARSENGTAVARGVEVVVTRFERGIAYVRGWEELAEGQGVPESRRIE